MFSCAELQSCHLPVWSAACYMVFFLFCRTSLTTMYCAEHGCSFQRAGDAAVALFMYFVHLLPSILIDSSPSPWGCKEWNSGKWNSLALDRHLKHVYGARWIHKRTVYQLHISKEWMLSGSRSLCKSPRFPVSYITQWIGNSLMMLVLDHKRRKDRCGQASGVEYENTELSYGM